ncbi:MAG: hypothetical protein JWM03_219 [Rhodocyclales bacterium]|nr:hypothetical protein [Rhodocyclales bacterium]MDB5887347.1 hypothetical protein [Rhodocyclales bacterium]
MAAHMSAYMPVPQTVLLCCPACGRENLLTAAAELPTGLGRLVALCPACEGHGEDATLLVFNDGSIMHDIAGGRLARSRREVRPVSEECAVEMSTRG